MKYHTNLDFLLLQFLPRLFQGRIRNWNTADENIDSVGIQANSGITDGPDYASPVRVRAIDRGLDQRRLCNRSTDRPRGFFVRSAFDQKLDEFRCTLSIA